MRSIRKETWTRRSCLWTVEFMQLGSHAWEIRRQGGAWNKKRESWRQGRFGRHGGRLLYRPCWEAGTQRIRQASALDLGKKSQGKEGVQESAKGQ